jgi:hypothetical protein
MFLLGEEPKGQTWLSMKPRRWIMRIEVSRGGEREREWNEFIKTIIKKLALEKVMLQVRDGKKIL